MIDSLRRFIRHPVMRLYMALLLLLASSVVLLLWVAGADVALRTSHLGTLVIVGSFALYAVADKLVLSRRR